MDIPEKDVESMALRMGSRDVSLDQPLKDSEGGTTFLDLQPGRDDLSVDDQIGHLEEVQLLEENIDQLRSQLNEREGYLLDNRLLSDSPLTLQEIGDKYGITREAVRQMESRLIKKLKAQYFKSDANEGHESP